MGAEFRLGRQDGHKVEDFLARQPKGVTAITLSTPFVPTRWRQLRLPWPWMLMCSSSRSRAAGGTRLPAAGLHLRSEWAV